LLRSGNGDEDNLRVIHADLNAAGKTQPARGDIAVNYFFKSRFINWHLAGLQLFDLLRVVIDANDVVPNIGETGAGHEADVTGADDCKVHD